MNQSSICIRVDNTLKQKFYQLCEDFGLSAATAINIFMKTVVRERKIPFLISSGSEEERNARYQESFREMRESLAASGIKEMSLEEINSIIKEVRDARKG